jgi:hypothetical protein
LAALEESLQAGKHLEIAQVFKQRTRPDQFAEFLRAELHPSDIVPSKIHQVILGTNFKGIITTNFDMVFERQGAQPRPLVYPLCLDEVSSFRELGFLAKIHGCICRTPNPAENLILTEESYVALRSNQKYLAVLHSLFVMHPTLTVGFSLRDPDFLGLLDDLRQIFEEGAPTVYSLMLNPGGDAQNEWRAKGIEIIPYEKHEELLPFFEEILRLSGQKEPVPTPTPREISITWPDDLGNRYPSHGPGQISIQLEAGNLILCDSYTAHGGALGSLKIWGPGYSEHGSGPLIGEYYECTHGGNACFLTFAFIVPATGWYIFEVTPPPQGRGVLGRGVTLTMQCYPLTTI